MKSAWQKWKAFAEKAGVVQSNFIFSAIYIILIIPLGFAISMFRDILDLHGFPSWEVWESQSKNVSELKEQ